MTTTALHYANQALGLAAQALFLSSPNPRVGCVITAPDGEVLGRGFTQRAGGAHAEIMALRDAAAAGRDVRGATAYVTLEPCSHHGRTGPCCNALIEAGIAKVVASITDPNPLVAGHGFERLRAAGIEVVVGPGAEESRELNIGFFSRMVRGTPWVRLKTAASLDGTTALHNGASQWITSRTARADGHAWRARACAILTGIGTVLDDNPRLDVREVPTPRQPHVVLVDSQLQLPPHANLLMGGRDCLVYTANTSKEKKAALEARGATVIHLPNASGKVDLAAMLKDLGQRGINELHVEAGHKLNGSLVREGLVDELLVYLAPRLLGPGLGMANLDPLHALADGLALQFTSAEMIGPDLRVLARVQGRDSF
ncbi:MULTISPECIES: bifunctional diaminohydroxyphosphoribosylaminopyrimidine deaminase/5-amino-6-(5-phosphoribosylamino)uracil reductase RibD [unclassified Acidovorax]|uniref:bifunctional diaminohydroxyphosphoribosylaminopyrimidine deaminase/5-amino-6-(5-phosphoribosylamino)uracil reductase RibD n=1 Tax=unclassified Acidovorax TaxID=2684926 RepID=UPI001C491094|nr:MULTISPECIES: bifunctional diaminohydroxyphosphoribosylaminopyrimidine deaminase/5-amino-6-(5-phosphoribosylamino)uracil reductase RibD [unclassified Acidovorax]MBV7427681.1 bifunctional diaminohydroxyphosphoribosylaminopyrimidine deaminase/5-amino-6-(5-phosphoribosylamino)uracil reductase RibD [Acidovorax sp. sif0732]MBV7450041.1 bifunctional diaminohydroxyphosphoribosylaminopyrimidine deaminase/5-amino-6-(5-phosphoribosylamino)uracil reductase RibD [Acidovorax sp. sif0715]